MSEPKSLDHLGQIADEMLGGLHADERMRLAIKRAAVEGAAPIRRRKTRLVPAICCAALAIVCAGAAGLRLNKPDDTAVTFVMRKSAQDTPQPIEISAIAAGDGVEAAADMTMMADLGMGARVRMAAPQDESLFAAGSGDIPLVALEGRVYRMLEHPQDIGASLLGEQIGSVRVHTDQPSLASEEALSGGLSSVAAENTAIYAVSEIDKMTLVACEVDGRMRLFQRVSYAGKGPGGTGLEDTFDVRGRVKAMTLSGVGTLEGRAANEVMDVLLDQAYLMSADATARGEYLTVTLESGLQLQLGVSGDTLCGCGGWSCPEFFAAFEAAL